MSLPKQLVLPILDKPHCCWVNCGILLEKGFYVRSKCVTWVNAVQQINDATQLSVELIERNFGLCQPGLGQTDRHFRRNGIVAIPYTCMMGAIVTQGSHTCQPTLKSLECCVVKILSYGLLGLCGRTVCENLGQSSEREQFKGLPCWWIGRLGVFLVMLLDELFLAPMNLTVYGTQVLQKQMLVLANRHSQEPKSIVGQ